MEISKNTSTILKGLAIIAVVAGHLGLIPRGGTMGVSIFLVLSGYGITKSWKDHEYLRYWRKRIVTVWFPYFLWTLFLLVVCLICNYYRLHGMNWYDFILTLLGLHPTPILDPTMWYIPYIFLCYLIAFVTYIMFPDSKKRSYGIVLFFIAGGGITIVTGMHHATYYTFCFPIGCLVAIVLPDIKVVINKVGKYTLNMCFLIACLFFYIIADKHPICNAIFATLFSMTVLIWFHSIDLRISIFRVIGEASYAIYLCEGMFIYIWQDYYNFSGVLPRIIYCILIILFGITIHYLYKNIRNKFLDERKSKSSSNK